MLSRDEAEALFLEHLKWIEKAAAYVCRRNGIRGADADDFVAQVRMTMIEDDYGVMRRFTGKSKIESYLSIVIKRALADLIRELRGRWRPSAAADRIGPPAGQLEALVNRDGYTLHQAGEKLRTEGHTTLSDTELARIAAQLPQRAPLRPLVPEPPAGMDVPDDAAHADDRVTGAEAASDRAKLLRALEAALGQLDPEDRLIARMHFAEGATLAAVARAAGLEQKPLYRRADRLRDRLRELLQSQGYSIDDVHDLIRGGDAP